MPKVLVVGNEEFEIPLQGENADYGESLTDFFTAIADSLTTVQQPNDILTTTAAINNNQITFSDIPGFTFDTSQVVAVEAEYIVRRTTSFPSQILSESGKIEGNYDGQNWTLSHSSDGEAGVEFEMSPSGQVQYRSTDLSGAGYVGEIIFKARVFNQES